jgi:hypothetical protein
MSLLVMAGLVPPARPKPLRRGEGPAIHVFPAIIETKTWMPGIRLRQGFGGFGASPPKL